MLITEKRPERLRSGVKRHWHEYIMVATKMCLLVFKGCKYKLKIDKFYNYLSNHSEKMDCSSAKRGGYLICSGAIASANKFIRHTRLKRSGAWWYIKNANKILKIKCAKYNGTYDKIIERYKKDDQQKILNNERSVDWQIMT